MIFNDTSSNGPRNLGETTCINPRQKTNPGESWRTSLAKSASYSSRAACTPSGVAGCCFLYFTRLWYAVGIEARRARSSPNASLRFDITRTISMGSWPALVLSIKAWRFDPLPDINTVTRIGDDDEDIACGERGALLGLFFRQNRLYHMQGAVRSQLLNWTYKFLWSNGNDCIDCTFFRFWSYRGVEKSRLSQRRDGGAT